ncbi:MAG TPA: hypothetical protein VHC69_15855 [Polyangiaceae bacterium]|nr:hypothetical protein [Polyangiaceae bacterium]
MSKQRDALLSLVSIIALSVACSSGDKGQPSGKTKTPGKTPAGTDGGNEKSDAGTSPNAGRDADGHITKECQGFSLTGLKYSPGGTTLPNKCAPFDATLNNPYAVRCIDALPAYKTRFPGDEYCILPPPDDQGIQVGLHPQGDDYWNQMWAGDMSGYDNASGDWIMSPGTETTQNYLGGADNPNPENYYRTYFRMRTGSHHNIITLQQKGAPEGWKPTTGEALPGLFDTSNGALIGILGGQQRPDDGQPATLEKPAEDAGLYLKWPASPAILYNMHHINTTTEDILREGWVNIWWESDATIQETWFMGMGSDQIAMNIPPGSTVDYHYSWTIGGTSPTRLVRLFGHRHFWTENFSSWIERQGDTTPDLIYDSFDWSEMPTYRYDSAVKNPTPDPDTRTDGAASGIVLLNPGDKLHFNCHIEYTDARASTNSAAPTPEVNGNLRFANETFKAEMCIGFGNVTGGALGTPTRDQTAVPDFATK